jgi:hypothetical protein
MRECFKFQVLFIFSPFGKKTNEGMNGPGTNIEDNITLNLNLMIYTCVIYACYVMKRSNGSCAELKAEFDNK